MTIRLDYAYAGVWHVERTTDEDGQYRREVYSVTRAELLSLFDQIAVKVVLPKIREGDSAEGPAPFYPNDEPHVHRFGTLTDELGRTTRKRWCAGCGYVCPHPDGFFISNGVERCPECDYVPEDDEV